MVHRIALVHAFYMYIYIHTRMLALGRQGMTREVEGREIERGRERDGYRGEERERENEVC